MKKTFVIAICVIIAGFACYQFGKVFDAATLKNKRVIVTGASSGIGEKIAYNYARMGASVFMVARRQHLLAKVYEKCVSLGAKDATFGYVVMDLRTPENARKVIEKATKHLGGLDQLILNHAYIGEWVKWKGESGFDIFDYTLDVNLKSFVHLTSFALPSLSESNGSIAVVSSMAGRLASPFMASYSASKFALDGFFGALRQELMLTGQNVSVTLCVLGLIDTGHAKKIPPYIRNLIPSPASVNETAMAIIRGTTLRQREVIHSGGLVTWVALQLRDWIPELLEYNLRLVYQKPES